MYVRHRFPVYLKQIEKRSSILLAGQWIILLRGPYPTSPLPNENNWCFALRGPKISTFLNIIPIMYKKSYLGREIWPMEPFVSPQSKYIHTHVICSAYTWCTRYCLLHWNRKISRIKISTGNPICVIHFWVLIKEDIRLNYSKHNEWKFPGITIHFLKGNTARYLIRPFFHSFIHSFIHSRRCIWVGSTWRYDFKFPI